MLSNQLDHLAAMERAATPGKWMVEELSEPELRLFLKRGQRVSQPLGGHPDNDVDVPLITALRNAAPELIAVVRAAMEMRGPYHEARCPFLTNHERPCACHPEQKRRLDVALTALANVLPVAGEVGK